MQRIIASDNASQLNVTTNPGHPDVPGTPHNGSGGDGAPVRPVARREATQAHIRAIDGLRALAILGVILYHMRPQLASGGFLGVTVFFVISGFLITRGMLGLLDARRFSYPRFMDRRARRIWPPVLTTIAFAAVIVYTWAPSLLLKLRADAVPSALFYSNWSYIFRHVSYFDAAGLPSPLTHLWYTSLIMQFYLLWPLLFALIARVVRRTWARACTIAVLIAISTADMAMLYAPGRDTSRIYYGLDTRAAELLVGALLAVLVHRTSGDGDGLALPAAWRAWSRDVHVGARTVTVRAHTVVDCCAFVCAAAIVISMFTVDASSAWMYHGGFLLYAALTALMVWAGMHGGAFRRAMGVKALAYLSSRSFSLYLVHYPLILVMNPATRATTPWWMVLGQFAIILIVGEVFHQTIEALRGAPWLPWLKRTHDNPQRTQRPGAFIGAVTGVVIIIVMMLPLPWRTLMHDRAVALRPELGMTAEQAKHELDAMRKQQMSSPPPKPLQTAPTPTAKPEPPKPKVDALKAPDNLDPARWHCDNAAGTCDARMLIIGDSVTEGVAPVLTQHFPNAHVDGAVSRQFGAGVDMLTQFLTSEDPQVIIFALGTNGPPTQQAVDEVIRLANGRPLYFLTTRAPVAWIEQTNQMFLDAAHAHGNVGVIDWSGLSGAHPEYLYDDGTHPNELGAQAYAQMILRAVCPQ
ncbi:acyltransferase family protein [Bifidobacterium criceti]|uniref:Acyltransferase n=1 Tax=Bifidobacterium criceti TaxID=1960969 RepID=A0A2A2EFE4_9BIFI|nr:acyltransferase family protein [Bifidobacterium criceti]PAU67697.1 acyltransferase [Bifidobacterium criceti]